MSISTALPVTFQFVTSNWAETPFHEQAGAGKLTRASVTNAFSGALVGQGVLEYLMCYPQAAGGDVPFIGLERIIGSIGGRTGSFTVRHDGAYSAATGAQGTLAIVAGSGTDGFAGVSGGGTFGAKAGEHGGQYTLVLDHLAAQPG